MLHQAFIVIKGQALNDAGVMNQVTLHSEEGRIKLLGADEGDSTLLF